MHEVLSEEICLESASEGVNAQIGTAKIIVEQFPCHQPSHSEGMMTIHVRLEPWDDE